jgi:hypothetical protein
MTLVWFTFIYYMTVNLMNTPPFDSYDCITGKKRINVKGGHGCLFVCLLDEHASMMEVEKMSLEDRPVDWMPELHDIPIGVVNAYLYQIEDQPLDGTIKPNGICLLPHQTSASRLA